MRKGGGLRTGKEMERRRRYLENRVGGNDVVRKKKGGDKVGGKERIAVKYVRKGE